jgi:hypothetical protein
MTDNGDATSLIKVKKVNKVLNIFLIPVSHETLSHYACKNEKQKMKSFFNLKLFLLPNDEHEELVTTTKKYSCHNGTR